MRREEGLAEVYRRVNKRNRERFENEECFSLFRFLWNFHLAVISNFN